MFTRSCSLLATSLLLFGCIGSSSINPICDPGATQHCACSGGGVGIQTCREDRSGWDSCQCKADAGDIADAGPLDTSWPDTKLVPDAKIIPDTKTVPDAVPDAKPKDSATGFTCSIGGVCDVPLAPDPSLSLKAMNIGEPVLEFNQSITNDRWGTIHLFWYADGSWHEKAIEHLPNASEASGRKWQLVRGVDYVCPANGPMPNWIACGTQGCVVPPIGELVHYVVVDNDGVKGKYTMRTKPAPYVWDFVRPGCES